MTWLVVWFKNGELHRTTVCRSKRTMTRIANSFNEYAEMYNRMTKSLNTVGVISAKDALDIISLHQGLPNHTPREELRKKRDMRHLIDLPVRTRVQ